MSTREFDPLEALDPKPKEKGPTQAEQDWQWLISDVRGRRIIRRLLEATAPFSTSFSADPATMAMMEGRKQLGYMLIAELFAAAPETMSRVLVNKEPE